MRILGLFILAIVLIVSGCSQEMADQSQKRVRKHVTIYTDPSYANIVQELTDVYESINDSIDFQIETIPEELAIRKMIVDSTSLTLASRPLYAEEAEMLASHKKLCTEYIIAQDALAFIVSKDTKKHTYTKEGIIRLLTENTDKKIIFDQNFSSSVSFVDHILGEKQLVTNSSAAKNVDELIQYVSTDKDAVGVMGSNFFSNLDDSAALGIFNKAELIGIETESGIFYPFQADIAAKKYPFARNIYILNSEHYYGPCTGFKNFVIGPKGQRIILKSGLLPTYMPSRLLNFVKKIHE